MHRQKRAKNTYRHTHYICASRVFNVCLACSRKGMAALKIAIFFSLCLSVVCVELQIFLFCSSLSLNDADSHGHEHCLARCVCIHIFLLIQCHGWCSRLTGKKTRPWHVYFFFSFSARMGWKKAVISFRSLAFRKEIDGSYRKWLGLMRD